MASKSDLNNHANIKITSKSGVVDASDSAGNYYIDAGKGDISNFAREGGDLIIEFNDGQKLLIKDFFTHGLEFNNLLLSDGSSLLLVDFTKALSGQDGINDPDVIYHELNNGVDATAVLLGLLGAGALAAGIAGAQGSDSEQAPPPVVDNTPPAIPSLGSVYDNVEAIVGPMVNGANTNDARPTFSGSAVPGSTIKFYDNGEFIGSTIADSNGNWSWQPDTDLSEGAHSITYTASDSAGNESAPSDPFEFTVDTTAPSVPSTPTATDNTEPHVGPIAPGGSTNETQPEFSGKGEPGSTITIKDGDTIIGQTTVDSDGNWSVKPDAPLGEGNHSITVTETDKAGNESDPSAPIEFEVDTTKPSTPSTPTATDNTEPYVGPIAPGGSTNETQPEFSGKGEPGSTITIKDGDTIIGEATVDSDGNWTVKPEAPLGEGNHSITVTETDKAGNVSDPSLPIDFEIDTTPPATPSTPNATDNAEPFIGTIVPGGSTNDSQPEFSGKGEPGSTITIKDGDTVIGETTVDSDGNWTVKPEAPLGDGNHSITVTETDKAGNESDPSAPIEFEVDTTPPAAIDETNMDLVDDFGTIQGTIAHGGPTDDRIPAYSGGAGSVDANDATTINIYNKDANGNVTLIGTTSVNADGSWSFEPNPSLTPGDYVFTARPVDKVGNEGSATSDWNFTVVGDAPRDPAITRVSDNEGDVVGNLQQNGVTDDKTPIVSGTGESGSTITIYVKNPDGTSFIGGTTVVDGNGNWTLEISPAFDKGDGTYTIQAQAHDEAGQLSAMTGGYPIILDTAAPAAPQLPSITDNVGDVTGALTPNDTTDDNRPVLSGNVGSDEAGGTITIKDGDTVIGTTTVQPDGSWSFTPPALGEGSHSITTTVTDKAGNVSESSPSFDITIDTSNVVVSFSHFVDNVGAIQGNVNNGGLSDDRMPVMVGNATANATVTISYINDQGEKVIVGVTTADSNGAWTLTPTVEFPDGTYGFTAEGVNAAGTKGNAYFSIEIDATAPSAPVIDQVLDDVGVIQGEISAGSATDDTTPSFSGTGEVGSTITIKDSDGTVVGQTTVGSDGKWSVTTDPLTEGDHNLSITATDQAGNESTSTGFDVTIDTQGPTAAAKLQSISEDTGFDTTDFVTSDTTLIYTISIDGAIETGDTVWLRIKPDGGVAGDWMQAVRNSDGTYSVNHNDAAHVLADGRYTIETIIRDAAGNPSTASSQAIVIDTQGPNGATVAISGYFDDVGAITGNINQSGSSSDDTTPLLKGTVSGLQNGDRVIIKVTGADGVSKVLGEATVTNGTWEYQVTDDQALTEGDYRFEAVVTDNAGNEGSKSNSFDLNIDLTAPGAINGDSMDLVDDFGPITGTIQNGGSTDDRTPTYSGAAGSVDADDVATINIYNKDANGDIHLVGSTTVNADGSWSFDPKPPLTTGDYIFTARPVDKAGNEGPATDEWSFTIVGAAPADPAITRISDNQVPVTGNLQQNSVTDDTTPVVRGTGTSGSTITIHVIGPDGSQFIGGTAVVGSNGVWTLEINPAFNKGDGQYIISAQASDAAGQLSNMTGGYPIILDTTAPQVPSLPTITDNVGDVMGDLSPSDTTDDRQPVLSGNAGVGEAGGTITIKDGETVLGTTTVKPDGSWSFTPPALGEGNHSITVTVTDQAGNESGSSPSFDITVDTSNVIVSFSHFVDNVGSITSNVTSGGISDDRTPQMVGNATANAVVTISYINSDGVKVIVGTTTADSTGAWSLTPSTDLPDGTYGFTAEATNAAGTKGSSYFSIEIDATAPAAPIINEVLDDVGFIQGSIVSGSSTDDTTPTFTGTGEVGATITIKDTDGNVVGKTTVANDGKWSITTNPLTEGEHNLTVTATDPAGNQSTDVPFDLTIDTKVPTSTAILASISDDSGFNTSDFITNDSTLIYTMRVNGAVETGDTVWMRIRSADGSVSEWIKAVDNQDGTYSVNHNDASHALADGNYVIETIVRDAAGNSSPSSSQVVIIDTQGPNGATVTISGYFDDVGAITGNITQSGSSTDDKTPLLKGTIAGLETGDRVIIKVTGPDGITKVLGEATVSAGTWQYQVSDAQAFLDGDYTFEAVVTDNAGNEGSKSNSFVLNIDTVAPSAIDTTKLDLVDDFGPVQGTINRGDSTDDHTPTYKGAAGSVDPADASKINIYNKGSDGTLTLIGSTTVNADGSWSFDPQTALTAGDYIFVARPVDKAGNEGDATPGWNFTIVGAAPSIPVISRIVDNVGDVTGDLQRNEVTDDTTPTLHGTGTVGSTITIHVTAPDGSTFIGGTTVVAADGSWTLEINPAFAKGDGTYTIAAQASDAAGQLSGMTTGYPIELDITAPSTPSIPTITDNVGETTGVLLPNDTTDDKRPVISGNAGVGEAGGIVTIKDGDTVLGTTTINADGSWSYTPPALSEGSHSISVTITDNAGNTSNGSDSFDLIVDTTEVVVSFDHFVDSVGSITGTVTTGGITDDKKPVFNGNATPNVTVTVSYVNSDGQTVIVGTTTANSDGTWTLTPTENLADGSYSFTAEAKNAAGNTITTTFTLEVDATAPQTPALPVATDNAEPNIGVITSGSDTNDKRPQFSGTGEVGSTITIKDGDTVLGTTTVDSDGNWSFMPDTPLSEGSHSITVTETDTAGNASNPSPSLDFNVDTTAPATPAVPTANDNTEPKTGVITAGSSTNETKPVFTGTGEVGSTITIKDGDSVIGTTTVDSDGNWSLTPSTALSEGNHSITVTETDKAGNASEESAALDFTVDTTAPATPAVPTATDNTEPNTGVITAGSSTNETQPEFTGTGEPGSTITIKDGDTVIGTTTVDSDGNWTVKPDAPLGEGDHSITVTETDKAGNASDPSGSLDFNVDTTAPAAIDMTKMDLVDDFGTITGTINRGDPTDDRTPTYSGAAGSVDPADAATINIYNKAPNGTVTLIGSTTVNADGSWSFDPNPQLTPGDYNLSARPVDKAGNIGPATDDWNFTVVGDAPADPAITGVSDNEGAVTGNLQQNGVTDDKTPVVSGTGTSGSTVTIHVTGPDGSTFIGGTTVVDSNGNWSLEITPAFANGDGTYTIKAQASDVAGQLSNMTGGYPIVLDTTAPATPSLPTITDNVGDVTGALSPNDTTDDRQPVLSGNAGVGEAGGTVTITDNGKVIGTTTVKPDGSWSFTPPVLADGDHAISITVTDPSGNKSESSPDFNIKVDSSNVIVGFDHFVDNVGSIQGNVGNNGISDDRKPVMVGNASANATVTISYIDGTGQKIIVGVTTADSTGAWTLTPTTDLPDGVYSFTADAENAAGTKGNVTFGIEIDGTAPTAPVITEVLDDVGFIQGPITSGSSTDDTTPTFKGTGEVGSTITIKDTDGNVVGKATVGTDGKWSITTDPLFEGLHNLTITATDSAGNESTAIGFDVTIDTQGSSSTAILQSITDDTGSSSTDFVTNDTTLIYTIRINGTIETGDTVWLRIKPEGGTAGNWIQATRNDDGTYSVNHNDNSHVLSDGNYIIETIIRDAAGNPSSSSTQVVTIDTQGPNGATVTISGYFDDVGAITGNITQSGTSTDDKTPLLKGTVSGLENGDRVIIKVTGTDGVTKVLGTATIVNGVWEYQVTDGQALAEGDYKFEAVVTDSAGNEGSKSSAFDLNIDTTAPGALVETNMNLVDDFGPVQGTINRGDPTDDRTPTYSGGAGSANPDDAATVNIYTKSADGTETLIGSTSVNPNGSWSFEPSPQLTPGDYIFVARPVDKAGNIGPATSDWNFTVVGAAPSDPAITSVSDNEGAVTGNLQQNAVTDDTTPVVSGTGTAGSTITIHVTGPDGLTFTGGTTVVDGNGNWSLEISPAFAKGDGTYTIKAQANDAAGQLSNMTGGYPIVLDTTAPATPALPTITDNVGDVTGALAPNDTTDDKQPILSGNAGVGEAGGTVTITDNGKVIGTTTVKPDGSWSFTPPVLADGNHSISVTVTDPSGNVSGSSPDFNITVDSSNVIVGFDHFVDNVGSIQGNVGNNGISDDRTPQMVGTASANATVTVSYVNGTGQTVVVGTTTADGTGAWTLTPTTNLPDGVYSFTADAENAAGTKGSVSFGIEIDGTAPTAPVIDEVRDDVGFIQGPITSGSSTDDTTPTFTGSGEVGSIITIKDTDGNVVGTTTVGTDGKWSITTNPLAEGSHNLTVTATDSAGNESTGTGFDVTIDTQGPTATAVLQSISDDTGFDTADFITSDNTLIYTIKINGTIENSDTVWLRIKPASGSAGDWIAAVRNPDGTYSVNHNDASHALSDGRYIIETIIRDAAGNPSVSSAHDITIDTQGPTSAIIAITGFTDDVGLITGEMTQSGTATDDTMPLLKGTVSGLQDGDRIIIKVTGPDGSKVLGEATVVGNNWTYQVTGTQALATEGKYTFEAVVTDNAGNEGTKSNDFDLNLNLSGPSATSSITGITEDTGVSNSDFITNDDTLIIHGSVSQTLGSGEKVQIRIDSGAWVDAVYNSTNNTWSYDNTGNALSEGTHTISSRVIDAAGNVSNGDSKTITIDTTGPIDGYEVAITGFTDNVGLITGEMTQSGTSTDDGTPLLKGTVSGIQDGDRIAIMVTGPTGGKILLGYATVSGGTWQYQVTAGQAFTTEGKYSFEAVVTDNAGNAGKTSTGFDLNLDLTAPTSTSSITGITTDTGFSNSDFITSDNTLIIHGKVSQSLGTGEKVQISIDGGTWLDAVYNSADNTWSYDNQANALGEGSHNITTRVIDAAGNVTNGGEQTVIIDTTAPNGATVSIIGFYDDIGLNTGDVTTSNSFTDDTKPLLKGTIAGAADGERVVIKVTNASGVTTVLGVAVISGGTWQYQVTDAQAFADGKYTFEAVVTDTAGNEGTKSNAFDINFDTVAPTATSSIVSITEDTGNISSDFVTRDGTLIINAKVATGTVGANERVQISLDNGVTWRDATYAAGTDTWSLDNTNTELADGTYTFKTRVIDAAGNLGSESSQQVIISNGVPSATADITHFSDNFGSQQYTSLPSGSYTDDKTPTLHGTLSQELDAGATVAIYRGTVFIGYATVTGTTWSFTGPDELKDGTFYTYYAAVQSLSGVNGTLSEAFEFAIDATDSNMAPNVGTGGAYATYSTALRLGNNGGWTMMTDMAEYTADGNDFRNFGSPKLLTWANVGNAAISAQYVNEKLFSSYTYGDYNRDGYMDMFLTDRTYDAGIAGSGTGTMFVGKADGTYEATLVQVNSLTHFGSTVSLDMDGDGWLDVVLGDSGNDSSTFLHNKGQADLNLGTQQWDTYGYPTANTSLPTALRSLTTDHELSAVDLNNSGAVDLVVHGNYTWETTYNLVTLKNSGVSSATGQNWSFGQSFTNIFNTSGASGAANSSDSFERTISLTWADLNGDGYMDLFIGQSKNAGVGAAADTLGTDSMIFYNDGAGNLKDPQRIADGIMGKSTLAIDWDGDGKMDLVEVPEAKYSIGTSLYYHNTGTTDASGQVVWDIKNIKDMGIATAGGSIMTSTALDAAVNGASAAAMDYDWDGDQDLIISRANTSEASIVITNPNTPDYGTAMHLRIVRPDGSNTFYGNTVEIYNSAGVRVASQIINPQYGTGWNDSSAIVHFYGLDPNETYTAVLRFSQNGVSQDFGGQAFASSTNPVENVNSSWTNLKATEPYNGYVLTAEADGATGNTNSYSADVGIVGTGYNDTFFIGAGTRFYNGGGGWVVGDGERTWDADSGLDIADFAAVGSAGINVSLAVTDAFQNVATGYTIKLTNIEAIYGTSGNDTITDGNGNNILNGRGGDDNFILSGTGHTTLLYEAIADDATGGNGHDTVDQFTLGNYATNANADRVDLGDILIGYVRDADGPAHFDTNGVAKIDVGDKIGDYLKVEQEGGNTVLYVDRDGSGGSYESTPLLTINDVNVDLATLLANGQIVV